MISTGVFDPKNAKIATQLEISGKKASDKTLRSARSRITVRRVPPTWTRPEFASTAREITNRTRRRCESLKNRLRLHTIFW